MPEFPKQITMNMRLGKAKEFLGKQRWVRNEMNHEYLELNWIYKDRYSS